MTNKKKKRGKEKKLDIHGKPVGDYRGKKWNEKLHMKKEVLAQLSRQRRRQR